MLPFNASGLAEFGGIVPPNTCVALGVDDPTACHVFQCGKNCTFTRVGQTLNVDNIKELSGKGWEIRYADTLPTKQDGPKSSGKAGEPQKD